MASRFSLFLSELKRRRVYHVAAAYLVFGVALVFGIPDLFATFDLSPSATRLFIVLIAAGFPIALVLAWVFEARLEKTELPEEKPRSIGEPVESRPRKSIIVLPFDNLSPDPGDAYLADGFTEEIITDLSLIRSLGVISRNSAMVLKGTPKNTRTIAEELDVQFVLEGSVRKAGNHLRITAQLIDAASDEHLWAERYDGKLDDVFDLQESVSRSIVGSLEISLSPEESRRLTERSTDSVQAYECYLKSREEFWRWSEGGLERALRIIQNGLEVLGENELLYAGLGTIYARHIHFGVKKDESYLRKAEACIEKVFSFNPESSRGHYLKGFTQWWRGDANGAVEHLKKALSIDPEDSDTLSWLAWIYAISGKGSAARPLFEKAIRVDPLNPSVYGHFSGSQLLEGEFELALETWRRGFQMDPGIPWFRIWMAFLLVYNGRGEEADEYLDPVIREVPRSHWTQLGTFLQHASNGERPRALQSVTNELKTAAEWDAFFPVLMADCFSMIHEKEEAISWLEEGVRWGCANYPFLAEYDPFLEPLRGEDRFKDLMETVKHRWETFEV
jgi:TolB-like protein